MSITASTSIFLAEPSWLDWQLASWVSAYSLYSSVSLFFDQNSQALQYLDFTKTSKTLPVNQLISETKLKSDENPRFLREPSPDTVMPSFWRFSSFFFFSSRAAACHTILANFFCSNSDSFDYSIITWLKIRSWQIHMNAQNFIMLFN